jgi:hypothetical protein
MAIGEVCGASGGTEWREGEIGRAEVAASEGRSAVGSAGRGWGVDRVPMAPVDGRYAACCQLGPANEAGLRAAGVCSAYRPLEIWHRLCHTERVRRSSTIRTAFLALLLLTLLPEVCAIWQCECRTCSVRLWSCCCESLGDERDANAEAPRPTAADALKSPTGSRSPASCACVFTRHARDAALAAKSLPLPLPDSYPALLPQTRLAPVPLRADRMARCSETRGPPLRRAFLDAPTLRAPPIA